MVDLNKRLVEVENILEKLDNTYKKKIPKEIWDYIKYNKDNDYKFYYDEDKLLMNQNLNIDTIAILTYINMEYLVNIRQKENIKRLLRKDEAILEKKKKEKYNPDNLFSNNYFSPDTATTEDLSIVKYKETIFIKLKNWIKNLFSFHN